MIESQLAAIAPLLVLSVFFGMAVGSFLNVCIDRLLQGESIVRRSSHCAACQHGLRPLDLVAVLSYIWLRGRCRYCGTVIPPRLAAVVVPNVGRFLGRGETEAANTELQNVQAAVLAMMVDNGIPSLDAAGCGTGCAAVTGTSDMTAFPATVIIANKTDVGGTTCSGTDGADWVLFGADVECTGDNPAADQVNYLTTATTSCVYSADNKGTVTQDSC